MRIGELNMNLMTEKTTEALRAIELSGKEAGEYLNWLKSIKPIEERCRVINRFIKSNGAINLIKTDGSVVNVHDVGYKTVNGWTYGKDGEIYAEAVNILTTRPFEKMGSVFIHEQFGGDFGTYLNFLDTLISGISND